MYRVPALIRPYPAHSLTIEDDANEANSSMLEAQEKNMRDAQQANHDASTSEWSLQQTQCSHEKHPRNAMKADSRNETRAVASFEVDLIVRPSCNTYIRFSKVMYRVQDQPYSPKHAFRELIPGTQNFRRLVVMWG
jgi:hypothetical protein